MTNTDNLDILFPAAKQLANRLSLSLNSASRCLLDQQIAVLAVLKCKKNKINSFFKRHDKTGHLRLG